MFLSDVLVLREVYRTQSHHLCANTIQHTCCLQLWLNSSELAVENGMLLEKVDKFAVFIDMLKADGGCDSAVMAKGQSAQQ